MRVIDRLLGRKKDPGGGGTTSAPTLVSITPASGALTSGSVDVAAATVTLSAPATSDTFVQAASSDPGVLAVSSGGVMILAAHTSGEIRVSVLTGGQSVTLSASLGNETLQTTIATVSPS